VSPLGSVGICNRNNIGQCGKGGGESGGRSGIQLKSELNIR